MGVFFVLGPERVYTLAAAFLGEAPFCRNARASSGHARISVDGGLRWTRAVDDACHGMRMPGATHRAVWGMAGSLLSMSGIRYVGCLKGLPRCARLTFLASDHACGAQRAVPLLTFERRHRRVLAPAAGAPALWLACRGWLNLAGIVVRPVVMRRWSCMLLCSCTRDHDEALVALPGGIATRQGHASVLNHVASVCWTGSGCRRGRRGWFAVRCVPPPHPTPRTKSGHGSQTTITGTRGGNAPSRGVREGG